MYSPSDLPFQTIARRHQWSHVIFPPISVACPPASPQNSPLHAFLYPSAHPFCSEDGIFSPKKQMMSVHPHEESVSKF
jgi:hypothetical protein